MLMSSFEVNASNVIRIEGAIALESLEHVFNNAKSDKRSSGRRPLGRVSVLPNYVVYVG